MPGPDEFRTASGQLRHLYSAPGSDNLRLNREYVPHIAAYAYAILGLGYPRDPSSFSRYRSFGSDCISKRAGESYETDVEFYGGDGRVYLQIEVKTRPREIERMGGLLDRIAELRRLPQPVVKEVEYVLDLAPRYLWLAGPGTVDPPVQVFGVEVDNGNAYFERLERLPRPPYMGVGLMTD